MKLTYRKGIGEHCTLFRHRFDMGSNMTVYLMNKLSLYELSLQTYNGYTICGTKQDGKLYICKKVIRLLP